MREKIKAVLTQHDWSNRQIIVAVSGGLDSMVLAHLLHDLAIKITVAHCNFGLRGSESDEDEAFVRSWCAAKNIPLQVQHFDTKEILARKGGNLQQTARDLRYQWFEQLRVQLNYDLVATAHHAQDSIETMLINFFRGTGIAGLHGILPQQNRIIRPLLSNTKSELEHFAVAQNVSWREDSSNQKDDYLRNEIRHTLMPVVTKIFPNVMGNLLGNIKRFNEVEALYDQSVEQHRKKLLTLRNMDYYLSILKLKNCPAISTLLWELIKPFNFNAAQIADAMHLLNAETGRYVSSNTHRIIKNRNFLIITPLNLAESTHILVERSEGRVNLQDSVIIIEEGDFEMGMMSQVVDSNKRMVFIDSQKLSFPLILRPWKIGDYFYPLGMDKKKKKVSKFLIEQKIPIHEKSKIWILESDKKIVWIVGMRLDERFKITHNTRQFLKLSYDNK